MGNIECSPCARHFIISLWVFSHLVLTQPSLLSTIIILIIYEMYNSVWASIHRGLFLCHTVSVVVSSSLAPWNLVKGVASIQDIPSLVVQVREIMVELCYGS